jgi:hypothetical protein
VAFYPVNATGLNYVAYPPGPTATGTDTTSSGSANTKGAYVQLSASSSFASNWAHVVFHGATTGVAALRHLVDIATGAGGAEVDVLPNLATDMASAAGSSVQLGGLYGLPLAIAISTRIAARNQSSGTSRSVVVSVEVRAAGSMPGITTFTNHGSDTSTSGGLSLDPGGTANTKGSYTQLTASLAAVAQFLLMMATHNASSTSGASSTWAMDIATGAGGSEVVLVSDMRFIWPFSTNAYIMTPRSQGVGTYIAASTRVALRVSCSTNTATLRLVHVAALYGTASAESGGGAGVQGSRIYSGF